MSGDLLKQSKLQVYENCPTELLVSENFHCINSPNIK